MDLVGNSTARNMPMKCLNDRQILPTKYFGEMCQEFVNSERILQALKSNSNHINDEISMRSIYEQYGCQNYMSITAERCA
uniref:Uncharacterized protein n=1 Tax=Arundo donax TaxID=35708 RepID=A0A0A9GE79_ARUDO